MKVSITLLLAQPLLHFLLLGVLLFVLHGWINDTNETGDNRIVIDRDALLEFVQYRNRAFNTGAAGAYLAGLSAEEYEQLQRDLAREEVLFREAQKLGLDRGDYIIKRRLVQKMEYLARGFGAVEKALTDGELQAYYDANPDRYRNPPTVTFTHVFVDDSRPDAPRHAQQLLETLNAENVPFASGLPYGDRFLYHSNYVDRDPGYIESHFGDNFAGQLSRLEADTGQWQGPIRSSHGLHLVMVAERQKGGIPPLAAIRDRVYRDAREEKLEAHKETLIQEMINGYTIVHGQRKSGESDKQVTAND